MEQLAGNLAKPVANVTGFAVGVESQEEKCLDLLKQAAPDLSRIGVLLNPDNPNWRDTPTALNAAAEQLGLVLIRVESRGAVDIDRTLSHYTNGTVDGLLLDDDSTLAGRLERSRSRYRIRPRAASAERQYLHYLCARWRLALARNRYGFDLSARGGICTPDYSWRAAERAAGRAPGKVSIVG